LTLARSQRWIFSLCEIEKDFLVIVGRAAALDFLKKEDIELADASKQAWEQADRARAEVLKYRRGMRARRRKRMAAVGVVLIVLVALWQWGPRRTPAIGEPIALSITALPDKDLRGLATDVLNLQKDEVSYIVKIDWVSPIYSGSSFQVPVEDKTNELSGFVTGRTNSRESFRSNKQTCKGDPHHLSCEVRTAYGKAYLYLKLRNPKGAVNLDCPTLTIDRKPVEKKPCQPR
jgi:hypothetical protein